MTVYLDCNATAPMEPLVRDSVIYWMTEEYGNAGSRTHEFGQKAKSAVQEARRRVAAVLAAEEDEIVFTSGATESDNLAILGLKRFGEQSGRRRIVTTAIEHKAVLGPIHELEAEGFEVVVLPPTRGGFVDPEAVANAVNRQTLLVSVMHVNNETGVVQPISDIASRIGADAFFHVDAAQGFGKDLVALQNKRIDLLSISSHKIYGPKGIGALLLRRRGNQRPPVRPLMYGGGQEKGLRPGTLPVPLIVGLGKAAELAEKESGRRRERCAEFGKPIYEMLEGLGATLHGDQSKVLSHVVNFSIPGIDSEAIMVALKGIAAVSNGSACTSQNYTPSHVLLAMGLSPDEVRGAIRMSWCHMSDAPDWKEVANRIRALR